MDLQLSGHEVVLEPAHLPCPACGEPSELPLEGLVEKPEWQCRCGFNTVLPAGELRDMIARIEKSRHLVRFKSE